MQYNEKMFLANDAIIKKCSPKAGVEDIIRKAKQLSVGSTVVQLFDASSVFSRDHLLFAYANAILATIEKRNKSNSVAMEMMLYAALTLQIGEAVEIIGAKNGSSAVLFSNSSEAYGSIKQMLGVTEELSGTNRGALEKLGAKDFDDILDKMSLLSISD
ncbi:MAG: KEOPS complex subunit Cgi121 [Candidatus Micrarchaeia archaeon]